MINCQQQTQPTDWFAFEIQTGGILVGDKKSQQCPIHPCYPKEPALVRVIQSFGLPPKGNPHHQANSRQGRFTLWAYSCKQHLIGCRDHLFYNNNRSLSPYGVHRRFALLDFQAIFCVTKWCKLWQSSQIAVIATLRNSTSLRPTQNSLLLGEYHYQRVKLQQWVTLNVTQQWMISLESPKFPSRREVFLQGVLPNYRSGFMVTWSLADLSARCCFTMCLRRIRLYWGELYLYLSWYFILSLLFSSSHKLRWNLL